MQMPSASHARFKVKYQSQALIRSPPQKYPVFLSKTSATVLQTQPLVKKKFLHFSPFFLPCREPATLMTLLNPLSSSLSTSPSRFLHSTDWEDLFSICLSLPLESELSEAGVNTYSIHYHGVLFLKDLVHFSTICLNIRQLLN